MNSTPDPFEDLWLETHGDSNNGVDLEEEELDEEIPDYDGFDDEDLV